MNKLLPHERPSSTTLILLPLYRQYHIDASAGDHSCNNAQLPMPDGFSSYFEGIMQIIYFIQRIYLPIIDGNSGNLAIHLSRCRATTAATTNNSADPTPAITVRPF